MQFLHVMWGVVVTDAQPIIQFIRGVVAKLDIRFIRGVVITTIEWAIKL